MKQQRQTLGQDRPELAQFSRGFTLKKPDHETVKRARELISEAEGRTRAQDFYVDEDDGSLGFMMRLKDGNLMLGEISRDGRMSGGTYQDGPGRGREMEFRGDATSEQLVRMMDGENA